MMKKLIPPNAAIDLAILEANKSPCSKSKRGAVIYSEGAGVIASGRNSQPLPFKCDGSVLCKKACAKLCEHAEAAAIRKISECIGFDKAHELYGDMYLLHVKAVDGKLKHSGRPSCWQCSRQILCHDKIKGIWLYHEEGWKFYSPINFHQLTLEYESLPIFR